MKVRAQTWGAALAVAMAGGAAWGGQPRVLIAAAATTLGSTDCRYVDVQTKLMATGMFSAVDIHDTSSVGSLPTLAELESYDTVLTYSNVGYIDNVAMGDLLADYMDAGGGVVVSTFANSGTATAGLRLMGRWQTGGYEVVVGGSGQTQTAATMGTVLVPAHPIMAGVSTFNGGSHAYRPTGTTLTAGSTLVARWSDNKVLVAVGANPRRVDLGFWPVSSDCRSDFWVSSTDGARLLANALVFAQGTTAVAHCGSADFNCDGDVGTDADIEAFFSCIAGACPAAPCTSSADFNADGDIGTDADIEAFFRVLGGGNC